MTRHGKKETHKDELEGDLVLNVQNQCKGIARLIEKKDEKNIDCIRADFIHSPNFVDE